MVALFQSSDYSLHVSDEFLPAVVGTFIVGRLIGPEAGLLEAQKRAATRPNQRPDDDALQSE